MKPIEFPLPFWLCALAIIVLTIVGWANRRKGWGLPFCVVVGTAGAWYLGDALYNDYSEYVLAFNPDILEAAWWEVLLFLVALAILVPVLHRLVNRRYLWRRSQVVDYLETRRMEASDIQRKIDILARALFVTWVILMGIALVRVQGDVVGLFAPYLGVKTDPWGRGRLGGGVDALLSLAGYLQIFLTASFGVIAALARNPRTRLLAIAVCCLGMPYYLFDRTRNAMLATMLPGLLAWIFFRLKGGLPVKCAVLTAAFLATNFWFAFVLQYRTGGSVASAFAEGKAEEMEKGTHHLGLNMFEELAWINYFIDTGIYEPNWGQRYFAEIVNLIPRTLWPGKPMIGIDYAIARGMSQSQAEDDGSGVAATVSTGMIGQGAVNFGRFLGPVAAALLMAIWIAVLARLDLLGNEIDRLLLYGIGMILTFNMGRDITLLVLYPFLFGVALLWFRKRFQGKIPGSARAGGVFRSTHNGATIFAKEAGK